MNHEDQCVMEIISLLFLSVCMSIASFDASFEQATSWFNELAQELISANLCSERSEAKMCIIPAFMRFKLLPKAPEGLPEVPPGGLLSIYPRSATYRY